MFAFMLTAYRSGSGKTTISSGITRAIANRGLKIISFKAGPDYIDSIYLARASKTVSYNLDTILYDESSVRRLFSSKTVGLDGAVVEGFMGLLDGIEPKTYRGSSYHVAKALGLPVIVVLDISGSSYTSIAVVEGLRKLATGVDIIGVILNMVASKKHEELVRLAILEHMPDIKVFGAVYKDERLTVPSRKGGLDIHASGEGQQYFDAIAECMEEYIDMDLLIKSTSYRQQLVAAAVTMPTVKRKVAIAYDDAFNFYYRSSLELLERCGYEKQFFSPLKNESLPDHCDLVLLGGGYIQKFADKLSKSKRTAQSIKDYQQKHGYIFAEGAGFTYLCNSLAVEGVDYPMVGVFDADVEMTQKRQQLGYVQATINNDNTPAVSYSALGHMVNYTIIKHKQDVAIMNVVQLYDGKNFMNGCKKLNCFGSHVHFMPDDNAELFLYLTGASAAGGKHD